MQKLDIRSMPNASVLELQDLLNVLPDNVDRMIVAPIATIAHSPYGGMVVTADGKMHQCSCVLSLLAHTGKSRVDQLARGHRIVSNKVWNIPFDLVLDRDAGAPDHADRMAVGEFASFCTMDNVQYYSLSPTRGKEPIYAIVMISSVSMNKDQRMYMIDKVAKVEDKTSLPLIIQHLKKLSWILKGNKSAPSERSGTFSPSSTPYKVKKARQLSECPTDGSLPEPPQADQT